MTGRIDEIDKELVSFRGLNNLDINNVFIGKFCVERNASRLDCDTSFLIVSSIFHGSTFSS
jgi:hypothetical protein